MSNDHEEQHCIHYRALRTVSDLIGRMHVYIGRTQLQRHHEFPPCLHAGQREERLLQTSQEETDYR